MEAASTSSRCQGSAKTCRLGQPGWRMPPARVLQLRVQAAVQIGKLHREPVPPLREPGTVVPGSRTKPTPLLSASQMLQRIGTSLSPYIMERFGAFYSSMAGGIVTDPTLMLLPLDDQFVVKGYGVAEIVVLRDGHLFMLDEHITRLRAACEHVGIELPFTEAAIKRIVLDTAAASGKVNGRVRFWVTPGRGGFTPLEVGGHQPALYVLCLSDVHELDRVESWDAIVAEQPILPTSTSTILGNQQLLTSVSQKEAVGKDCHVAIFTDAEGFVQHCAGYTVCMITQQDILVFPPFENSVPSITLARMLDLIPEERERSPNDVVISDVQQRKMHVSEILAAKECFLVGTTFTIAPVRSIDGKPVNDNRTGLVTLALHYTLDNDMLPPPPGTISPYHIPVPYGFMTGMRSQLM
ncbi:hypothetical protein Agub_g9173 [Astrephomene gubernaculifera]|uniref:Uncharacterized protein n=1 Tax=Astrephomene gubernaculifera TaxID=47775 RepID=A0AAD3HN21_9CHLO|nr:hypothetical protein Agub_g9173 [Astrephomene gubernaculifera]